MADWKSFARRAERITGLDVIMRSAPDGQSILSAVEDGTVIASVSWPSKKIFDETKAVMHVRRLIEKVYRIRSRQTMEQQDWKCFCCARISALEIDHITPRSKGRDDRRNNLRALSPECHQRRHSMEDVSPHPDILDSVAKFGWKWGGERVGWVRE